MFIEIIYPMVLLLCVALVLVISTLLWIWHKHLLQGFAEWLNEINDRAFYRVMDWLAGCKGRNVMRSGDTFTDENTFTGDDT